MRAKQPKVGDKVKFVGWTGYADWVNGKTFEVTEVKDANMSANDVQEGGDHYKKLRIQPWDYIDANGIGYFEGSAIAYLTRWRDKGGVQDLRKARHYIDKLIEIELGKQAAA